MELKSTPLKFFFVSHFNWPFGFSGLGQTSYYERSTDFNANFHATKSRLACGNEIFVIIFYNSHETVAPLILTGVANKNCTRVLDVT